MLIRWDGREFLKIATYGYDASIAPLFDAEGWQRTPDQFTAAFFPGYPMLMAAITGPLDCRCYGPEC